MVHCEVGTESTWEAFVLECNKNKENGNHLSTDIIDIKQPVSRDKPPNDDSRDDIPTRRESMQYSSINITKPKHINIGSKKKSSPTSVRTKLNSGGGSKKKKNRRQSAEWLDLSTDSSSSHTNSSENSIDDDNIDPNELVNQLNQIYIDQLLDVSEEEEKQNESLNSSIEIDDNNILYLSPQQSSPQPQKNDKNNTASLLDITNDITLTPSSSFLQLEMSGDQEKMNVLEFSEITLGSSFLTEIADIDKNNNNNNNDTTTIAVDAAAVDRSFSSRLDVSDNMDNEFEIVMNEHQNITREVTAGALDEVSKESVDTSIDELSILDKQQHTLNDCTVTCDEFITEALQTSFIENVKLGYNVVTNKLEKEFIDMGFADCISG